MKIKDAKNLHDSIKVYSDKKQYRTIFLKNGVASWYGESWNGNTTSTGDIFDASKHTAASATIPTGSFLKITNLRNHKVAFVKVNDIFPRWNLRDLDLSKGAAQRIGMIDEGVAHIKIERIEKLDSLAD
jgi:rare lipoprotein A